MKKLNLLILSLFAVVSITQAQNQYLNFDGIDDHIQIENNPVSADL